MNLFKRLFHFEALKNKLQKWLEIKNYEEFNQEILDDAIEDIKDKVLFELSFIDKMALSEQDKSKLYHAQILYFLRKDSEKGESIAYTCDRYYRANSKDEAYGAGVTPTKFLICPYPKNKIIGIKVNKKTFLKYFLFIKKK